jgi:potassium channel subfamily K
MEFAESVPDFWNRSMRELRANARHLRPLLIALVVFVVVSALILVGVEGGSYGKAVYLTWITMTTVGYGDFVPSNTLGRVCVSVDAFVGLILIGVIVWVVTVSLTKRQ